MGLTRTRIAALTAVGALALTACAAPTQEPQDQPTQQQTQAPQPQDTAETAPEDAETQAHETNTEEASAPEGTVFTTKEFTYDGHKLSADVYEIEDDGSLATVNLKLTNVTGDDQKLQLSRIFSDGNERAPGKDGDVDVAWLHSMRGITLTDTKNKKIHRVAYDSTGKCLCDINLHQKYLEDEEFVYLSASFASIPDGQETATVTIPNLGALKNVPINR